MSTKICIDNITSDNWIDAEEAIMFSSELVFGSGFYKTAITAASWKKPEFLSFDFDDYCEKTSPAGRSNKQHNIILALNKRKR